MYNYKVVEMNIYSLYGKSVALIGYGVSNRALLEYLTENGIDYWRTDYSGSIVYRIDSDGFERVDK